MPRQNPVRIIGNAETGFTDEKGDPIEEPELPDWVVKELAEGLAKLRAPFPEDQIEKRPQPMWKNAWEDQPKGRCDDCGGYHVLAHTIHLDYVGHAGVTSRLLEVDPFWEWEPLSWTEQGQPRFDGFGGLWIKLTVCGVTRLGYGDAIGKAAGSTAVKEIIGDAIRNAAMRFGVALDLWSKVDRHEGKNPGATYAQSGRQTSSRRDEGEVHGQGGAGRGQAGRGADNGPQDAVAADESPRAPNQDALDSLGSVCDENGLDRRTMREQYAKWAAKKRYRDRDLLVAHRDRIYKFAEHLLEGADPEDDGGADTSDEAQAGTEMESGTDESGGDQPGVAQAGGPEPADSGADEAQGDSDTQAGVVDTSDVEKQEGDMF